LHDVGLPRALAEKTRFCCKISRSDQDLDSCYDISIWVKGWPLVDGTQLAITELLSLLLPRSSSLPGVCPPLSRSCACSRLVEGGDDLREEVGVLREDSR
jgi:hypothetical protein